MAKNINTRTIIRCIMSNMITCRPKKYYLLTDMDRGKKTKEYLEILKRVGAGKYKQQ